MRDISVLTVVGARPQFIKEGPVSAALQAAGGFNEILVHTGQHFDREMSEAFFSELGLPEPSINLGIHGGTHGAMTGRMLSALEEQMTAAHPDWVLVYGDTNSTLAGALAAAKLGVPIAHVEAGLRSFDRTMPEELNRLLVDRVSVLLFAPSDPAVRNLSAEGITEGVHEVGDVMLDANLKLAPVARRRSRELEATGVEPGAYALATVHREPNTSQPALTRIVEAFNAFEEPVVFPLHP